MRSETLRRLASLRLAPEAMAEVLSIIADMESETEGRRARNADRMRTVRERCAHSAQHKGVPDGSPDDSISNPSFPSPNFDKPNGLSSTPDKPDVAAAPPADEKIKVGRKKADDTELLLDVAELWNDAAASIGLPQMADITAKRQSAIRARVKDFPTYGFDDPRAGFAALLAKIRGSPFLTGQTQAGFRANFDFATKSNSFHKIMEGSYEAARETNVRQFRR